MGRGKGAPLLFLPSRAYFPSLVSRRVAQLSLSFESLTRFGGFSAYEHVFVIYQIRLLIFVGPAAILTIDN